MPELPEVEVVRRGLADHVAGRTVAEVEVGHPRAVRRHPAGAADLSARLRGRVVGVPRRRGKYLWLPLDAAAGGDEALVAHLGMSGQLLVASPQAPDGPHLRVRVRFRDGGDELRFVDQRTFGGLAVEPTDEQGVPASVRHIARDPFDPQFDDAGFVSALRRRRTETKRALLDQTLVSGVGNIYADEALWRARIHPRRPTSRLSAADARRLLDAVRAVMTAALEQGGTTFDGLYLNVNGASGYFDRSLDAYGRAGLPCRRCGAAMVRERFTNRSSCFCPRCQPRPRVRRSGDSA